jgi:hypothetical protein
MRSVFTTTVVALWILAPALWAADITLASGVTVPPGESAAIPVILATPAPVGGIFATLSSSDPSKVTVSGSAYIPGGMTTPFSQPQVTGVAFGSATISVSSYGLTGDSEIVRASGTLFGPTSQTVQSGTTVNVVFSLSSPTPTSLTLNVSSDNPSVASVPSTVAIPAGGSIAVVPVAGSSAGSSIVHVGAVPDIAERTVNISVVSPANITLSTSVSMALGQSASFPVTLGTPAPAGGVVVTLSSSDSNTVSISPSTVFIPQGATTPAAQPQVNGVSIGAATITASAPGYLSASVQVPVTATLTMIPTSISMNAGTSQLLSMALSSSAPSGVPITPDRGAGGFVQGITVQLTSSNPNVAGVQSSVQFYPDGSSITTVVVVITATAPGTAVIHASALPYIPDVSSTVTVAPSGNGGPASITTTVGTPQTASINTPFGISLVATVRDAFSQPVSGVFVTFTAPASGPSATFAGGVNVVATNVAGVATSPTLFANGLTGTYTITAAVPGLSGTANFILTNAPAASGNILLPSGLTIGTNQSVSFPVTLTTPAPPGGVSVNLLSTDPTKVSIDSPSVLVPGGSTAPATQPRVTGVNFGSATIGASAIGYASASQLVQVGAALSFSPSTLTMNGLGQQNLTLNLSSPVPASGLIASLGSSNPGVATVPASVTFGATATSATVPVTAVGGGSATITASANVPNVQGATASVTVAAGADITLASGVTVAPGQSASLLVSLSGPAPAGGVFVGLSSSDPSKVTVSASAYIPGGMTTPFSQPQVTGVAFGSATINATSFGLTGSSQLVRVVGTLFGPTSQTVQSGATVNVVFSLSSPAPTSLTLNVSSDNPSVASVPSTVAIPAGGSIAIVPVTGSSAGSTVVHVGAVPDIADRTVNISVVSPANITLSASVSMALGQSASFPVTLGTPAPAGGVVVTLSSSDSNTVSISPSSVVIPQGATTPAAQPQVNGVNIGVATITASAPGYLSASVQVPVTATLTMIPGIITMNAGTTQLLLIALSSSAPSGVPITPDRGAGGFVQGITVQLTSSNPDVAGVQSSVQFYPDGSSFTTVVVLITGTAPGTAVIHASALPYIPDTTATVYVQ